MFERAAGTVLEFFKKMKKSGLYKNIDRGYENWTIIERRDGMKGIRFQDVIITSLVHRSGAEWQVELRIL
jgi:hypothetical protein